MLTEAQFLDQLLNPPKRVSNSTVTSKQRSSGGQFEGRAGSIVRNSKGGRKRLPNGRRQFIVDLATWHRLGLSKDTQG